jgi:hypothetical protein
MKPNIVFCLNPDNKHEIDFIGRALLNMNGYYLVSPIFHTHDALIVPREYVIADRMLDYRLALHECDIAESLRVN